jgi:hypothetical protein
MLRGIAAQPQIHHRHIPLFGVQSAAISMPFGRGRQDIDHFERETSSSHARYAAGSQACSRVIAAPTVSGRSSLSVMLVCTLLL